MIVVVESLTLVFLIYKNEAKIDLTTYLNTNFSKLSLYVLNSYTKSPRDL